MVSVKDGVLFNYERFKQAYRRAARIRGIDPAAEEDNEHAAKVKSQLVVATRYATKETSFLMALVNAELRRDLHHSRMRQSVRDAAARQLKQARRGVRWEEGRGLLTEDYQTIDELLVAKAESTKWWDEMGHGDWKPGDSSNAERQATAPVARVHAGNAKAARFKAAGTMIHEVLEENPTQADMKAKQSQKEIV